MPPTLIFVCGVSGSGKTTIGQLLSERCAIPFFDADDYHPPANKKKMQEGQALNDDDRSEWLKRLNQLAIEQCAKKGAIIACSALKERYRQILSDTITVPVHWVFLQGSFSLIEERMKKRKNHYMPASLLKSQFDILEMPTNNVIVQDITKGPAVIAEDVYRQLVSHNP